MRKTILSAMSVLAIVAGCIEVQRMLDGRGGEIEWGRDSYGPAVLDEPEDGDTEGGIPDLPEEVVTNNTESGLTIIDVAEGTGEPAESGDEVQVHYTGWLEDGTKFDSSLDRDEPFTLNVGAGEVIAGWDEGLVGMTPGSKRRLIIPAELAYGQPGQGETIPPNATLIFDIEMLTVNGVGPEGPDEPENENLDDDGENLNENEAEEPDDSNANADDGGDENLNEGEDVENDNEQPDGNENAVDEPDNGNEADDTEEGPPDLPEGLEEVETESGLRYIVIEEGTGEIPSEGDEIEAHYTGWLESDGTKFDSSYDRGTPFTFPLGQGRVIAGWDEGFATMRVGERRRLIIPPELGYGASGTGTSIPPNATLIFDVELLSFTPQ